MEDKLAVLISEFTAEKIECKLCANADQSIFPIIKKRLESPKLSSRFFTADIGIPVWFLDN